MLTLLHEGGWPIWFTLLFGLGALAAAARFARSSERRHLGLTIGLSLATLFSTLNGVAADLAAVGHHLNARWPHFYTVDGGYQGVVMGLAQGFAESMSPAILGFTLLALTWLVATVGLAKGLAKGHSPTP